MRLTWQESRLLSPPQFAQLKVFSGLKIAARTVYGAGNKSNFRYPKNR
jgi:hypothetical protein